MNLPTPDAVQITLTLGSLAVAWVAIAKLFVPASRKLGRAWNKVVGFCQTIAGRDPIIDKVTGHEVSPAVPPLGTQLATINETMSKLVTVIESNQNAHDRIDHVNSRVDGHDQAIAALVASTFERGADAALKAVENQNNGTNGVIDVEADE